MYRKIRTQKICKFGYDEYKKSIRKHRHCDEEFKKNAIKLVENGSSVK
jgi:hypothetical protein